MKIYFSASISGGRNDANLYQKLIAHLKRHGKVLTEHIGEQSLSATGEDGHDRDIYLRDLEWLRDADMVIAEVSTPSLGVGFEVAQAVRLEKRVLCLYRRQEGKRLSAMIAGCPEITVADYTTVEEAQRVIDEFVDPDAI